MPLFFSDLTSIKETADKGYILTGNYNLQCSGADKRSFLLKTDSMGNVEWRRTYNQFYTFFDIEIAADSGFYVPSSLNGTNAMQLVKINKSGNVEWNIRAMYNSMAGYPLDLCLYNNQYAIMASYFVYDAANFYTGLNISKVDLATKSLIWEKDYILYKSIECIGLHQAIGVETLSDGSIIVNGTLEKYGSDKSAFILKLNSNGDSLWTKTYRFKNSNSTRSQLNDLLLCDDGGFLGVGYYSPSPCSNSSAWMFKTDANGTIGFEGSRFESSRFKVYPNPAREYITFEFQQGIEQDAALRLYNALGQMVLQKSISKTEKETKLDLKGFKPGIYFFELVGKDEVLGSGKFVRD
jgi:hypothetical protein